MLIYKGYLDNGAIVRFEGKGSVKRHFEQSGEYGANWPGMRNHSNSVVRKLPNLLKSGPCSVIELLKRFASMRGAIHK